MRSSIQQKIVVAATAAFFVGAGIPAFAQTAASAPDNGAAMAAPASVSKADQKKQAKAQQKQARKEARAKKNAELKKLEDAGYRPGQNSPNYPEDLQNAQKKAAQSSGQ